MMKKYLHLRHFPSMFLYNLLKISGVILKNNDAELVTADTTVNLSWWFNLS